MLNSGRLAVSSSQGFCRKSFNTHKKTKRNKGKNEGRETGRRKRGKRVAGSRSAVLKLQPVALALRLSLPVKTDERSKLNSLLCSILMICYI